MADFLSSFATGFSQSFGGDLPEKKKGKDKGGKDKTDANPDTGGASAADVAAGAGAAASSGTNAPNVSDQFARGGPVLPRSGVQGSKFKMRR